MDVREVEITLENGMKIQNETDFSPFPSLLPSSRFPKISFDMPPVFIVRNVFG